MLARYAIVGRVLTGDPDLVHEQAIDRAVRETAALAEAFGIPALRSFGLTGDRVPEMVALAKKASSMRFNPVALSDEVLGDVLNRAV